MTTAHRPQTTATRGQGSGAVAQGGYFTGGAISHARSIHQIAGFTKLKERQDGQGTASDLAVRDLKRELAERERAHWDAVRRERDKRGRSAGVVPAVVAAALLNDGAAGGSGDALRIEDDKSVARSAAGGASSAGGGSSGNAASAAVADILAGFDDADDDVLGGFGGANGGGAAGGGAASVGGDDSDDDDDDDDAEELMRELEKIKAEREAERTRKEREAAELAARQDQDAAAKSNPLMPHLASGAGAGGSALVKRRFGDDTVFSHTHSAEPESKKRFINDVIRSDFHRSFLKRFVQ